MALASRYISATDEKYPPLLREITDPPAGLHFIGAWDSQIFEQCLGVVGSRKMSGYGQRVVTKLVGELAGLGITIVSGFMYGVDAYSHETAMKYGGRTIAVMPCGADVLCPANQQNLYSSIIDSGGLVLSEYADQTAPQKWTFSQRNRIIAGLCSAVVVVEAAINSGSLITARYALKNNRKVFVIPGDILAQNSQGIYQLVKEGALLATCSADIANQYSSNQKNVGKILPKAKELTMGTEDTFDVAEKIVRLLKIEPLCADELSSRLGIPIQKVNSILTQLAVSNAITDTGDNSYYVG